MIPDSIEKRKKKEVCTASGNNFAFRSQKSLSSGF